MTSVSNTKRSVVVIGAGVVGVSAALALLARGFAVTLIDREGVAAGASFGNAGAFAFPEIEPLAAPGIMRKAPGWLFDRLGPLSIPPSYALQILPWLARFARASRPERYAAALKAQASLMKLAQAAAERQIASVEGERFIQREGQLQLYEGTAEFEASRPHWEAKRAYGVRFELLDRREQIAEIQPGLAPRFTHAGFTPDWFNTVDPDTWTLHLSERFLARGGHFKKAAATRLAPDDAGVQVATETGEIQADYAVVAAGAHSLELTKTLGDRPPLETERGYNTTLPAGAFHLRTHLSFSAHGFVASKINGGVRIGGAVELGGLKARPNYRRSQALLDKAKTFLPGLKTDQGTQWMGFRPSMPDSLPVISRAGRSDRVIYAFGHGHVGLTQSAATGELVAALAATETPPIDLAPFDVGRF